MQTLPPPARAALAACALALPFRSLSAAGAAPSTNLPPIIVQASRTGRTAAEMPANVRVVTADEIARAGHANVLDVLQKQMGVPVKNFSDNPTTASVALRGFGEASHGRVLILLNGERLNNPDLSAPSLMRIPVQSVKRIEVVRGPQTVLYGDFAEAGVINIITDTSVAAEPVTTVAASAGSYDSYASHLSKSGAFEDGVSYFAAADWNKTGGFRDNGDYEAWNLDAAVSKEWAGGRRAALSAFYHDSEYGLPGALSWQQLQDDPRQTLSPNDRAWFETWGAALSGGAPAGDHGTLDATLTGSRREASLRYRGATYRSDRSSAIDSAAFSPRYTNDRRLAGHENRLTAGADLRYDTSDINSRGSSFGFPYAFAWGFDRAAAAAYAKEEFFLSDTLSLSAGARAERFEHRVSSRAGATSYSDVERAYDAALLYRPAERAKLFARAARYYHAPFIDEAVGWTGAPNTDLVPEAGTSFELGAEAGFAREWTAGLTAFEMDTKDEIYYNPTLFMNVNAPDDTRRRGVECALRWERPEVASASLAYDYTDAAFTEGPFDGKSVPLVPQHLVTVNAELCLTAELAVLGTVRYASSQHSGSDFANARDKLADTGTLDLALRYEPGFLKGLRLLAGLDNALNREYAACSFYGASYYPAPGRTWKVGASYSF